jgi:hypothetical protein
VLSPLLFLPFSSGYAPEKVTRYGYDKIILSAARQTIHRKTVCKIAPWLKGRNGLRRGGAACSLQWGDIVSDKPARGQHKIMRVIKNHEGERGLEGNGAAVCVGLGSALCQVVYDLI